ncbi:hypothetical protein BPTFM16_00372 [Altererythrobacter insulae]|nr:hypothetical protein BPTFM16_00372 [Altererythrobacter insulae]
MIVDPAIAALRSDRASQQLLRDEMARCHVTWCADNHTILCELEKYGQDADLERLDCLSALVRRHEQAHYFVDQWQSVFAKVLMRFPLAQFPHRHHYSDGFANLEIASSGGAALSLLVYEEKPSAAEAKSAVFTDRELHEIVLSGAGEASFYNLDDDCCKRSIAARTSCLSPGMWMSTVRETQSRQIDSVVGRLTILQLSRVPSRPKMTQEFALTSGQLLKQSSGDKRTSQHEMAMAVLTAMGRTDAAPACARVSRSGPVHLRWEAVRHALALDFAQGWTELCRIAEASEDALSGQARNLHRQLCENYPQLADDEAA